VVDFSLLQRVHCIGIGGIGLSAIAEILLSRGVKVSGSDAKESEITDGLIRKGATVYLGHRAKNIEGADAVLYSAAIAPDNPELLAAQKAGIPTFTRAQALGALMSGAENSIAVAGAHGKTTATAMISLVLKDADKDPTILVGGSLNEIGGNARIGGSEYFVTEACEYMDSFLELRPKYAVILNIDSDHLDYFKNIDHIVKSFQTFANLVPEDGVVFAFDANPFVGSILQKLERKCVTFGFHANCDFRATDIEFGEEGTPSFTVIAGGQEFGRIKLAVVGEHNIANALAAISCASTLGVPKESIIKTLESFTGTQRRFETLGFTTDGVKIVDDYAHHPEEITATLKAARNVPCNKLWVLFQPHTYTRTLALHDEFAKALSAADCVVLAEVYPAREKNIHNVTSRTIAEKMKRDDPWKDVWYFPTFEEIAKFALENAQPGDMVITMGAGDINAVGEMLLELDRIRYLGTN